MPPFAPRALPVRLFAIARAKRGLGWCFAWLCGHVAAAAQPAATPPLPFPEDYVMLLEACRGGEATALQLGKESLGSWPAERLNGALAAIRDARVHSQRDPLQAARLSDATLTFAALLHTDLAFGALDDFESLSARAHLDMAGGLLRLLPEETAHRDLRPRWILAIGCRYRRDFDLDEARVWLKAGLAAYPGDARLLLALGSADEVMATYRNPVCPTVAECGSARERERYLSVEWDRRSLATSAERLYRQALASDPGLVEARLRLGRVLSLHASRERGRELLAEVAQQARSASVTYLAHLFLGALLEEEPTPTEALAHYRSALSLRADAQAARLALALALRRSGDRAGEREILRPLLGPGEPRAEAETAPDPWWLYALGPAACDPDEWRALRREAGL
jgi:hypothetical protein